MPSSNCSLFSLTILPIIAPLNALLLPMCFSLPMHMSAWQLWIIFSKQIQFLLFLFPHPSNPVLLGIKSECLQWSRRSWMIYSLPNTCLNSSFPSLSHAYCPEQCYSMYSHSRFSFLSVISCQVHFNLMVFSHILLLLLDIQTAISSPPSSFWSKQPFFSEAFIEYLT